MRLLGNGGQRQTDPLQGVNPIYVSRGQLLNFTLARIRELLGYNSSLEGEVGVHLFRRR